MKPTEKQLDRIIIRRLERLLKAAKAAGFIRQRKLNREGRTG